MVVRGHFSIILIFQQSVAIYNCIFFGIFPAEMLLRRGYLALALAYGNAICT